jgi:hypothetical protein
MTHAADGAYWHEWEMFSLPGGIQLFNLINILTFLVIIGCFIPVIQRKASGFFYSLTIAALSALILPIHSGFALAGFTQFNLPFSIFVIASTFIVSIVQVVATIRYRHEFSVD